MGKICSTLRWASLLCWFSIQPATDLPQITDAVIIDGYTQPGASENTATVESRTGLETVLRIELDGSVIPASLGTGLVLADPGSTVRGLVINRFRFNGINIVSGSNIVETNYVGTNVTGDAAVTTIVARGEDSISMAIFNDPDAGVIEDVHLPLKKPLI